jgi:hypothetical protein
MPSRAVGLQAGVFQREGSEVDVLVEGPGAVEGAVVPGDGRSVDLQLDQLVGRSVLAVPGLGLCVARLGLVVAAQIGIQAPQIAARLRPHLALAAGICGMNGPDQGLLGGVVATQQLERVPVAGHSIGGALRAGRWRAHARRRWQRPHTPRLEKRLPPPPACRLRPRSRGRAAVPGWRPSPVLELRGGHNGGPVFERGRQGVQPCCPVTRGGVEAVDEGASSLSGARLMRPTKRSRPGWSSNTFLISSCCDCPVRGTLRACGSAITKRSVLSSRSNVAKVPGSPSRVTTTRSPAARPGRRQGPAPGWCAGRRGRCGPGGCRAP